MLFNSFERAVAKTPSEATLYILIYFKLLTLSNIVEILDAVTSLLFWISKNSRFVHPLNILFILVIWLVIKLDNLIDCNWVHPSNILIDNFTNGVLKFDKSNDSNLVHPENKLFIRVTFEVSKLDKSKDCNWLHPWNVWDIDSNFEVITFEKIIFSIELHWANMLFKFVIKEGSKLEKSNDIILSAFISW